MKRIILIVLCIICFIPVFGQKRGFVVFKVNGDVCLLQDGEWHEVARRDTLSLNDILRIRPDSQFGVLDLASSQVYYAGSYGEKKLAMIISDAKRQADKVTGLVNQQIRESLKSENKTETYVVTGVSYRGNSSASQAEKIYADLYGNESLEGDGNISLKKIFSCEDEFYFQIKNNSDKPLVVNVLRISLTDGKKSLCFDVGYTIDEPYVIVAPDSEMNMEQYVFYDSDGYEYQLFATPQLYDTQELGLLLNFNTEPSVQGDGSVVFGGRIPGRTSR